MEEIDNIIIESLKNLDCDIAEDIYSLKQFDTELTVAALSSCVHAIEPDISFPKKLPHQMSLRLKIASDLAEQIKDLGFRGDIGYQTILYCNEAEIRRVLMFLIERLPRYSHKTPEVSESGYVPKLVKNIEEAVKKSLEQMWIPTSVLHQGARPLESGYVINSLGNSVPLKMKELKIVNSKIRSSFNDNEAAKHYWIHLVPDVTKQCSRNELLPSLLFKGNDFPEKQFRDVLFEPVKKLIEPRIESEKSVINKINISEANIENKWYVEEESQPDNLVIKQLLEKLEKVQKNHTVLKESIKSYEAQLTQSKKVFEEEKATCEEIAYQATVKRKTLVVANNEEKKQKLQSLIEEGNERLVILANQWNEVQTPLLEEYKMLQNNLSTEQIKQKEKQEKLQLSLKLRSDLLDDLNTKKDLLEKLVKKSQEVNKNHNRSAYTRRIMEIIANVKKQNIEIQKVLGDTKNVQKEINSLTGKIDRSFTLADELIFRDCKHDEIARKAYKLLASLRNECEEVIKAISEVGSMERECRNLQDQVDVENAKEISKKLEQVLKDLENVQGEIQHLKNGNFHNKKS